MRYGVAWGMDLQFLFGHSFSKTRNVAFQGHAEDGYTYLYT